MGPLDEACVLQAVEETKRILVLEDHLMRGGLASAISDLLVDKGVRPEQFLRMGIPQVYAGFGSGEDLHDKYGYGLKATVDAVRGLMK